MARPPGADDEYQELQKRFQILESERKNLFEHTQLEVKKNKEALAKVKKENKELRSSLSSLMYAPPLPTHSHMHTHPRSPAEPSAFHLVGPATAAKQAFEGMRLNLRGVC